MWNGIQKRLMIKFWIEIDVAGLHPIKIEHNLVKISRQPKPSVRIIALYWRRWRRGNAAATKKETNRKNVSKFLIK